MPDPTRATEILSSGSWTAATAVDRVTLDHDGRHRRRIAIRTEGGRAILLDLPTARRLRDGDALVLEDGGRVLVRAAAEPVADITAPDIDTMVRLAWHLGNRHLALAVLPGGALRIRADHVIEAMVRGLGGQVLAHSAPFDPEPGAYGGDGTGHGHGP